MEVRDEPALSAASIVLIVLFALASIIAFGAIVYKYKRDIETARKKNSHQGIGFDLIPYHTPKTLGMHLPRMTLLNISHF